MLNTRKTPFMVLINKCDLAPRESLDRLKKNVAEMLAFCPHGAAGLLNINRQPSEPV